MNSFNSLPNEILVEIIKFLEPKHFINVCLLNKRFNDISKIESLQKKVIQNIHNYPLKYIKSLYNVCVPHNISVYRMDFMCEIYIYGLYHHPISEKIKKLEELDIKIKDSPNGSLIPFVDKLYKIKKKIKKIHHLHKINIKNMKITPLLKYINKIYKNYSKMIFIKEKLEKSNKITPKYMKYLIKNIDKIKFIHSKINKIIKLLKMGYTWEYLLLIDEYELNWLMAFSLPK